MLKKYNTNFDEICIQLENKTYSSDLENLLKNSLFYYCCGKDITPIFSLKEEFPIFIYADKLRNNLLNFKTEISLLYKRIQTEKLTLKKVNNLNLGDKFLNVEISLWQTKDEKMFILLFIQGDAVKAFKRIFETDRNLIFPKCFANIKYEMDASYFLNLENEVEYILGHCFNKRFYIDRYLTYKGDYSMPDTKVILYKQNLLDFY